MLSLPSSLGAAAPLNPPPPMLSISLAPSALFLYFPPLTIRNSIREMVIKKIRFQKHHLRCPTRSVLLTPMIALTLFPLPKSEKSIELKNSQNDKQTIVQ